MKKKIIGLTLFSIFILILSNYKIILSSSIYANELWLNKIFPFLFIMIIINDIMLSLNITNLFSNKYNYIFITSFLSGTPTNAYIITNLYQKGIITKNLANYSLLTTYFCNPLFIINILNNIFSKKIAYKIILIHYLSKFIINIIYHNKLKCSSIIKNKSSFNLSNSIQKAIKTNLMVFGTITLFLIITNIILNIFKLPQLLQIIIKGILELTQGLNSLILFNKSLLLKELLTMLFLSLGGLSIHIQIKSIINKTDLDYKFFLKGRILEIIISSTITLMLYKL